MKKHNLSKERIDDIFGNKHFFGQWMIGDIIPNYENNVYALTYVGAAILIFIIGLRGIKFIPREEPTWIFNWPDAGVLIIDLTGYSAFLQA